jgi:hypothetical protein
MYRSLIRLHRASVPQCLGWGTHYRTLWLAYRSNVGSAKLLSFGVLAGLSKEETLALFGGYYRDVLATPDGDDHPNIRNFMKSGWDGVKARSKCPLGQRPSSAPAPPQGAPGSSGQLGTRRKRPTHWALSHRLGCSSEPPPKLPIPPPSHLTTIPSLHHPIPPGVSFPWGLMLSPKAAPGLADEKGLSAQTDSVADALAASEQIGGDDEWDPDSEIWIP